MTTLPPLPTLPPWPPATILIIGAHQWAVLGDTLARLHADHLELVGQFTITTGVLMSTIADLTAAVTAEDAKVEALIAAYNAAKSNPNTTLAPADQTALDAAVGALNTTGAAVDVANPPAVVPAPAP